MKRLALVGYGRIATKHLEVFRYAGREFVASVNRSAEGRLKAEREGGIPRTYSQINAMLDRERPTGLSAAFRQTRWQSPPLKSCHLEFRRCWKNLLPYRRSSWQTLRGWRPNTSRR